MRSDKSLKKEFVDSELWENDPVTGKSGDEVDRYQLPDSRKARLSLSGSENNSLFAVNAHGHYRDISGISGLDSESDSRCIAVTDMDHDGRQEFLVTNTNDATLKIFRNEIPAHGSQPDFVAVRVVGGNQSNQPSKRFSNRDGVGSKIVISSGKTKSLTEVRCGEGLATQDGPIQIIGIRGINTPAAVEVVFPSGVRRGAELAAGKRMTFFEDDSMSANGSGVDMADYRAIDLAQVTERKPQSKSVPKDLKLKPSDAKLRIVMSMATWCEKCRSKIEEIAWLQQQFGDQLEVLAIPVDLKDSQEMLDEYVAKYQPGYKLLNQDLMRSIAILDLAESELGDGAIPHSFVLTGDNRILWGVRELPTLSELKQLAARHGIVLKLHP